MMKGIVLDDNMSNLTSASNEASISSSNINEIDTTNPNQPPPSKKKRNLPGNPDPDAEVVALSPTTLMATNRFMCEICNKGFKRDQNLQLHRRGHNLPWKLKQRANKDVIKKKVYVCPEPTCIHNDPSRALGDLTGIKKHFSRKHGEKKWKCEKCSKRYAVQSDWKAHSKICGTREYRCDCGTLFSRRDSFITHRAFCDALTEESTKAITTNPLFSTQLHNGLQAFQLKREQLDQHHIFNPNPPNPNNPNFPPWLAFQGPPPPQPPMELSSQLFSPRLDQSFMHPQNHPNPNLSPSPHMSATSLLQRASQMGVTMSTKPTSSEAMCGPHQTHMTTETTTNIAGSDLGLSSHEERESGFVHGLSSFGNKAGLTSGFMEQQYDHMMSYSLSSTNGFGGGSSSPFEEAFNGMLNQEMGNNNSLNRTNEGGGGAGLTRDFLGLGPFPNRRFSNMGGLDQISSSSSYDQMNQSQPSWQG